MYLWPIGTWIWKEWAQNDLRSRGWPANIPLPSELLFIYIDERYMGKKSDPGIRTQLASTISLDKHNPRCTLIASWILMKAHYRLNPGHDGCSYLWALSQCIRRLQPLKVLWLALWYVFRRMFAGERSGRTGGVSRRKAAATPTTAESLRVHSLLRRGPYMYVQTNISTIRTFTSLPEPFLNSYKQFVGWRPLWASKSPTTPRKQFPRVPRMAPGRKRITGVYLMIKIVEQVFCSRFYMEKSHQDCVDGKLTTYYFLPQNSPTGARGKVLNLHWKHCRKSLETKE
jgi:hypothetical protein